MNVESPSVGVGSLQGVFGGMGRVSYLFSMGFFLGYTFSPLPISSKSWEPGRKNPLKNLRRTYESFDSE